MSLVDVREVRARLESFRWTWAEANEAAIATHWRRRVAERPRLFDGRVLMASSLAIDGDRAEARFFETRYACLLAWLDLGRPDPGVANGFAMGALQADDGAFLLGRMAPHTANAGRLYCPCGTPDLSDVGADGRVDLAGSLEREIAEETGFTRADYAVDPGWTIVREDGLIAFMRRVRLRVDRDGALARMRAHLAAEPDPELSDVVAVASLAALAGEDVPATVPPYLARAFAEPAQR